MAKVDPDGPAFPTSPGDRPGVPVRVLLAGLAMKGLCHNINTISEHEHTQLSQRRNVWIPKMAVVMADALIAELNK